MEWDQWVILFLGPTAVALSMCHTPQLRKWGPVLGLAGQAAWFYTLYIHEQWGAFFAGFAYTFSWGFGFWKNWNEEIMKWYEHSLKKQIGPITDWCRAEVSMILNAL